jgi:hypothetical protein
MDPPPSDVPSPSTLSHADLSRILGPAFAQHLGLQPSTFLPELSVLARAVQDGSNVDPESIVKIVHRVRFGRCKAAWSQGEVDVDTDVTEGDLRDAAREIVSCFSVRQGKGKC